jgi:CspA family cold shock protein
MRENGFIKAWRPDKGYGFISREGCPDLFCHVSEVEAGDAELIQPGTRAEFVVGTDSRGRLQALDVVLQGERQN